MLNLALNRVLLKTFSSLNAKSLFSNSRKILCKHNCPAFRGYPKNHMEWPIQLRKKMYTLYMVSQRSNSQWNLSFVVSRLSSLIHWAPCPQLPHPRAIRFQIFFFIFAPVVSIILLKFVFKKTWKQHQIIKLKTVWMQIRSIYIGKMEKFPKNQNFI